jgi:hypothetical protein
MISAATKHVMDAQRLPTGLMSFGALPQHEVVLEATFFDEFWRLIRLRDCFAYFKLPLV